MTDTSNLAPPLSTRGGALLLKSISLFHAAARNAKPTVEAATSKKRRRKKMSDKEVKCPIRILEMAKRDTRFSNSEIEVLYKIFKKLVSANKSLPRADKTATANNASVMIGKPVRLQEGIERSVFWEFLHNALNLITEDTVMERIFCAWDQDNHGVITIEAWLSGLSIFLKGTIEEKRAFCFNVYDLNADGFITREEIFQLLKNCLIKHPQDEDPEEGVKDLVEIVLRKLDIDKDGKISKDDYQQSVIEEPLLIEAFARCLPDEMACLTFFSTIKV